MKQVKIILDSIMLILLPLLMAYSLIGERQVRQERYYDATVGLVLLLGLRF